MLSKLGLRAAPRIRFDLVEVLGPRHPWTLTAAVNPGDYLFDLEEFSKAPAMDETTDEMARSVLGADPSRYPCRRFEPRDELPEERARLGHSAAGGDALDVAERRFGITRAIKSRRRLDCDLELPPF